MIRNECWETDPQIDIEAVLQLPGGTPDDTLALGGVFLLLIYFRTRQPIYQVTIKTMVLLRLIAWASLFAGCAVTFAEDASYRAVIEQWRAQQEAELKGDGGWLTVSGLFWLEEGVNVAGSTEASKIVLPRGPAQLGIFTFHAGVTTFRTAPGVAVKLNGQPARGAVPATGQRPLARCRPEHPD
jgi:hypothetical protein